jgi:hypothetical protein
MNRINLDSLGLIATFRRSARFGGRADRKTFSDLPVRSASGSAAETR